MIQISLDHSASNKAMTLFKNSPEMLEGAISRGLQKVGLLLSNKAKTGSPILTGNLRRSITGRLSARSYIVGTNVEYAAVHEFGHTFRGGRRINPFKGVGYFRPAMKFVAGRAQRIFINEIKKWT